MSTATVSPTSTTASPTAATVTKQQSVSTTAAPTTNNTAASAEGAGRLQVVGSTSTRAEVKIPDVPQWITVWKDLAAATQSTFTVGAIVAAAVWFYRRRERFPRANITHQVSHWRIGNSFILHTIARVENVGAVALRLFEVRIRAQKIVPVPEFVRDALVADQDPVVSGQSEVLWPSVHERICDWSRSFHIVEPGEIEEIPLDLVIPVDVGAVEVYTYIRNVAQRRPIGWGTNTVYALASGALPLEKGSETVHGVLTGEVSQQERIEIMATKQESTKGEVQKQAPPKTSTQPTTDKRQSPEKTSTADSNTKK